MKSAFIIGFVKTAVELGYDDNTIARIFKKAMANPGMTNMFNQLPDSGQMQVSPEQLQQVGQQNPQHLAIIQQLLAQQQNPVQQV